VRPGSTVLKVSKQARRFVSDLHAKESATKPASWPTRIIYIAEPILRCNSKLGTGVLPSSTRQTEGKIIDFC